MSFLMGGKAKKGRFRLLVQQYRPIPAWKISIFVGSLNELNSFIKFTNCAITSRASPEADMNEEMEMAQDNMNDTMNFRHRMHPNQFTVRWNGFLDKHNPRYRSAMRSISRGMH